MQKITLVNLIAIKTDYINVNYKPLFKFLRFYLILKWFSEMGQL